MSLQNRGHNFFCRLYPLSPSHRGSVWVLPVISLLLTSTESPLRACLNYDRRGFVVEVSKFICAKVAFNHYFTIIRLQYSIFLFIVFNHKYSDLSDSIRLKMFITTVRHMRQVELAAAQHLLKPLIWREIPL